MKDLRLELRLKNNVLWHAIYDAYPSIVEFCRRNGLSAHAHMTVGGYLNLVVSPYRTKGAENGLTQVAQQVCDATGIGRAELWPPDLYARALEFTTASGRRTTRRVAEIDSRHLVSLSMAGAQHLALPAAQGDDLESAELRGLVGQVVGTLTPIEQQVIESRFGLVGEALSLVEVAAKIRVGPERIRQIEAKALRKLRHPSRSLRLTPFVVRQRRASDRSRCSARGAYYCQIHGYCACDLESWSSSMASIPACPLHGQASLHALGDGR